MSGNNNIQKPKSPRPIAPAPSSQPSSSSSSSAAVGGNGGGGGNEINGKRKIAPRPPPPTTSMEESIKPLIKIQPNNIKKDSPPTPNNNNSNSNYSNGGPSQQAASTPTSAVPGQMMTGSYVLRPVSNPNQRMFPFYSASSAHPHLQQRLQATIDPNGNLISNNNHQILTENQLHQLQQQQQRSISVNQQQQQQQRPPAPIPIAPRPSSISSGPSTSEAIPSSSSATPTAIPVTSKPPKICPRPIEKKPPTVSQSNPSGATTMNINPQNIIPTPQLNAGGALIGFAPNGTPIGYLQHPSALGVHPQLRFIQSQGLTRMQMSHINPMSIFPHHPHQQIIHPAFLSAAAGGNATFISQGIPNGSQMPQYLSISGFNPSQIPTSFMNSLNSQVSQQQQQQQQQQQFHQHQQQQILQQQQQQQQRKLIPITAIPSTSMTTTNPSTSSAAISNPPTLMPRPPPTIVPIAPAPTAPEISLESKILESTSDDDENEPPPLLDRDETVPASVHEAFVQEAAGVRMQFPSLGTSGNEPLRHFIDGFIIEESSVPFEIDDNFKDPMDFIRQVAKQQKLKREEQELAKAKEAEEKESKKDIKKVKKQKPEQQQNGEQVKKKRGRKSNNINQNGDGISQKSNGNSKITKQKSASPSKSKKRRSSSSTQNQQQQQQRRPSPVESIKSPLSERPGSSKGTRKSREIENLIKMDFGPKNQVFKTTSVDEYTKAIKRGQQTSLRPVILQDYKERSPEISREGDEQQCLNCKFTFAELKLRCEKYPQYCTKECRKEFRKSARKARQEMADAKSMEPSSSSSNSNIINEMSAALIGKSPESSSNNGIRKRLSNESEASTVSHIPTKSSPLKLRIRSSSDLESPASSSQILSPIPSTSGTYQMMSMMMPGPSSSTPTIPTSMNISNGSIPPIASPPPIGGGPPPANSNFQHFSRITEQIGLNPSDVNSWSAEDVGRWVNIITNSQTNGDIFISEEIDGSSLFMLSQNQITTELKVKLGPTLKIVNAIEWLRNL